MWLRRGLAVAVLWSEPSGLAAEMLETCQNARVGVRVFKTENDTVYEATGRSMPLESGDAFLELALDEARMTAKVMLRKDGRVPKTQSGQVVGIVHSESCTAGGAVLATLQLTEQSVIKAINLSKSLGIGSGLAESYLWISD